MKLVRNLMVLTLTLSLAFSTTVIQEDRNVSAQNGVTQRPCGQPDGVGMPVDLTNSTPSTEPRLPYHLFGGLAVEWAGGDWSDADDTFFVNKTVLFVPLSIPWTGAVTIENGIGATVEAQQGNLVLMVCGGSGEIDLVPDDQSTTTLADGDSFAINEGDLVMIFLEETAPATYWIFGAGTDTGGVEAMAEIQVLGENGTAEVCGYAICWTAPELPPRNDESECDFVTCRVGSPGGCGGVRCWSP
jgi:hypothetical protein